MEIPFLFRSSRALETFRSRLTKKLQTWNHSENSSRRINYGNRKYLNSDNDHFRSHICSCFQSEKPHVYKRERWFFLFVNDGRPIFWKLFCPDAIWAFRFPCPFGRHECEQTGSISRSSLLPFCHVTASQRWRGKGKVGETFLYSMLNSASRTTIVSVFTNAIAMRIVVAAQTVNRFCIGPLLIWAMEVWYRNNFNVNSFGNKIQLRFLVDLVYQGHGNLRQG